MNASCTRCHTTYPRTREYFRLALGCRDALSPVCRICTRREAREAYARDPAKFRARTAARRAAQRIELGMPLAAPREQRRIAPTNNIF